MAYIPVDIDSAVKKECRRRRYSERTAETYLFWIHKFLKYSGKTIDKISKKDVRLFLEHLSEREKAGSTMNVCHMALRFLFEDVLEKRIWIDLSYSKIPKKLPTFLTKEEIKKLICNIKNHKHKLMIALMYGAGLRVSELITLKIMDLNFKEKYGFVRNGKGGKDRIFIIPEKLQRVLMQICVSRDKKENLFLTNRNEKYSLRSLQQIVKKAASLAGLNWREIHCHTLRHSFATHLIEQGMSLNEVQSLLGHKSPETTQVYVHLASPSMIKVKSLFDSL